MKRLSIAIMAMLVLPLLANLAHAKTQGFTTTSAHMRAGPGISYPVVATLPQDATIEIYGCQTGYSWCDVSWNAARGWISSNYILTDRDGKKSVLTPVLAAEIGIAIIEFNQAYWNNHYEQYPWYADWNRYYHPYHPAPGPYCYHAPQDPACHYAAHNATHPLYHPAPHYHTHDHSAPYYQHHGAYGHHHHHSHPGSHQTGAPHGGHDSHGGHGAPHGGHSGHGGSHGGHGGSHGGHGSHH
ncbi:SH3 domain-containing protein [Ruegeria sp. 2205SS24-7]|uniref:SH3 domain-containing protein n=1 Tax=Ruegeria discodermiae TaxID=3064389 RepID=UPI002741F154|nr:SH3 domain-containing protein [Ruegeria sp. 2205SS24-7]MDP5216438.1 SH3 domain-containing protein [Ruegeria sp. 2205SS24-7]